jgi:Response regulator containing a CheY-like receiver domain and an HTH DNA-binding domain
MSTQDKIINVALADDHVLLRDALATLIKSFDNCQVLFTASNGKEVIDKIEDNQVPDVLILDLNMPVMDGYETINWLQKNKPEVHTLMLTMYDTDLTLIRLLQAGVKGFLKKDIHPDELKFAIRSVVESGYYYSHYVTGKVVNLFRYTLDDNAAKKGNLSETEIQFLRLSCTEMTYKAIATEMNLSPRHVDSLRDQLFLRLDVKSRVGLAMFAIRHGLISF